MYKFHVQSGKIKKVIMAADANAAALWLINLVVETFYPQQLETGAVKPFEIMEDRPRLLGEFITVFQVNPQRQYPWETFDTMEILTEWNELVIAVSRMEKRLINHERKTSSSHLCPTA